MLRLVEKAGGKEEAEESSSLTRPLEGAAAC
jgi:hypothetical protein